MNTEIKVGNCSHRFVWSIIVILQFASIGLIIASVFTPIWATTTDNQLGLYQCSSSCSKDNYRDERSLVCSQANFALQFGNQVISNTFSSGCKMFEGLESGLYAYVICAGSAIFFTCL